MPRPCIRKAPGALRSAARAAAPPLPAALAALAVLFAVAVGGGPLAAQGTQIRLGQALQLTDEPLDVSADVLEIDQESGSTVFQGNVRATQGGLRLRAERIALEYAPRTESGRQQIDRLIASGGVTLVTPGEAIEAAEAIYSLREQTLQLRGDVVFVQGDNVVSGDRFSADLRTGTGSMHGRVRSIIRLD